MAKSVKTPSTEGHAQMSTPQLDVDNAKNVVKYFENMKKANEEIGKMIEFNLKESREQLRNFEKRLLEDPAQMSILSETKTAV